MLLLLMMMMTPHDRRVHRLDRRRPPTTRRGREQRIRELTAQTRLALNPSSFALSISISLLLPVLHDNNGRLVRRLGPMVIHGRPAGWRRE